MCIVQHMMMNIYFNIIKYRDRWMKWQVKNIEWNRMRDNIVAIFFVVWWCYLLEKTSDDWYGLSELKFCNEIKDRKSSSLTNKNFTTLINQKIYLNLVMWQKNTYLGDWFMKTFEYIFSYIYHF